MSNRVVVREGVARTQDDLVVVRFEKQLRRADMIDRDVSAIRKSDKLLIQHLSPFTSQLRRTSRCAAVDFFLVLIYKSFKKC